MRFSPDKTFDPAWLDVVWIAVDTPWERYELMTKWREAAEAMADAAMELQARAIADANDDGMSYAEIAAHLGVSRSRAQQLIRRGRQVARPAGSDPGPDEKAD